jgi:hypothetical protein
MNAAGRTALKAGIYTGEKLVTCGEYVSDKTPEPIRKTIAHAGHAVYDFVPPREARPTWNEWWNSTGSVNVEENLTINAGISWSQGGQISAKNFTTNSLIDFDLLGHYDVQNSKTNAVIGLNTGLLVSHIKKIEWDKVATKDNALIAAEVLVAFAAKNSAAPAYLAYKGGKLGLKGAKFVYKKKCLKAILAHLFFGIAKMRD